MTPAFLTAFFFALNATCANRNLASNGPVRANLGRLTVATLVLGGIAHTVGGGFGSASVGWFFLSGIIGMGIGDLGLYAALPLLGSRLTVLMAQCLATPIAALGEWIWLGTRLTAPQVAWGLTILAGVALAITPSKSNPPRVKVRPLGFVFGFLTACGQGLGALVSRKGVMVAEAAGETVHNATFGLTSAYHRIFAGLIFTLSWFLVLRVINRLPTGPAGSGTPAKRSWPWLIANGFSGPIIGVGCYQWALATTPSGIVLPIVATAPLLSIPIAHQLEGDHPTKRAIIGGIIAVGGAVALAIVR